MCGRKNSDLTYGMKLHEMFDPGGLPWLRHRSGTGISIS
jgi:hypothetical protein